MKNIYNLPLPLFTAVAADPYHNGGADISVTSLLKPIQMWILESRHKEAVDNAEDCSERLWATYGQLMSTLLERVVKASPELAARYQVEIRSKAIVEGWLVSGAFDLYDRQEETLSDYKFVGSYAAKRAKAGDKEDWEIQTNLLRWLFWKETGTLAKKLQIVLLLRDYSATKSPREGLRPCEVVDIPVWELERAQDWIVQRLALIKEYIQAPDTGLLECSDEERWLRGAISIRCEQYCGPGRAGVCQQWNQSI
jgi:hypothetical protein